MTSRAFFRCRACGEPVVAGAYRCPVCGIDFPAGTPGTPKAAYSEAELPEAGASSRAAIGAASEDAPEAPRGDDERPSGDRVPAVLPRLHRRTDPEPAAEPAAASDADGPSADAAASGASASSPGSQATGEGAFPSVRPERAEPAARGGDGDGLKVRPARAGKVLVVEPAGHAFTPPPRRRSKARNLAGTLALALILLLIAGGVGLWFAGQQRPAGPDGEFARALGSVTEVSSADGWVVLPKAGTPLVLSGTGPFRVRVDGTVYSMDGSRAVRLDRGPDSSVAVRAIRPEDPVTVRGAGAAQR